MFIKMPHQAFITFLLPALDHRFFAYCTCIICHDQYLSNLNNINHIPLFKSENIFQKHHWLVKEKIVSKWIKTVCNNIIFYRISLTFLFMHQSISAAPSTSPPLPCRAKPGNLRFFQWTSPSGLFHANGHVS